MQTLSNGVKKPEDDDAGNVWSDGLEENYEILNTLITTVDDLSNDRPTRDIDKANWVADIDGKGYSQNVSLPGALSLDKLEMRFRVTSGSKLNRFINPTILPTSLTDFKLVVNDSTLDLEILFI